MGVLSALVLVVVTLAGVMAERGLRARIGGEIEASLHEQAELVAQLAAGHPFDEAHSVELQAIARSAADATGARVTLVSETGRVLADSAVPPEELPDLDNHAGRPEIVEAMQGGVGSSKRRSDTLKRDLQYMAVRGPAARGEGGRGVVRLAVELGQVEAAVTELRAELIAAGALGLIVALGLTFVLSVLTLRPIRELREVVGDMAKGRLERQLRWASHDERQEIAGSINRMAQQLRDQVVGATREKEQLEAVLGSMVEGVLAVDRKGRILLANPRLRELLSVWGDVEGRTIPEVIRFPEVDSALSDAGEASGILVRELEIRSPKERVLLIHAVGFPKNGPRSGTVAVFHDVSELRRVDRVRQDFIANASHELRTPLTAIQGFADTLQSGDLEVDQMRSYLDVIARNAQRMSELVNDLLALSRIESGRSPLNIGAVDVVRLTRMLLSDFAPRFEQTSLVARIHVPDPDEGVPTCRADPNALEQILSNLLSNAARYTNEGGRIDVHISQEGERVAVSVEDTGIGIPDADLERIFERFYRVDAARSRALGGTGLGLAIVKHLVNAMDGDIRVTSEPNKGTRFTFTLPSA